jgi:hypothetical protein
MPRDPIFVDGEPMTEALFEPEFHPTIRDARVHERGYTDTDGKPSDVRVTKLKPRSKAARQLRASVPTPEEVRLRAYQRGW